MFTSWQHRPRRYSLYFPVDDHDFRHHRFRLPSSLASGRTPTVAVARDAGPMALPTELGATFPRPPYDLSNLQVVAFALYEAWGAFDERWPGTMDAFDRANRYSAATRPMPDADPTRPPGKPAPPPLSDAGDWILTHA